MALGQDREELLASLAALASGDPSPNLLSARAKDGKLAYLLTGQGSQRLGMGRELYESDPHFQAAFDRVCEQLDPHLEAPLKEIVFAKGKKAAARLEDTTCAQPALFAIEVALYEALAKRGLEPDLLAGHSIGEIAAAQISGVLELPDAAKLVAARGRLMGALPAGGAMAAIEATEAEAAESIAGKEAELLARRDQRPLIDRDLRHRGGGRGRSRPLGGAGPKDQAPQCLPRLPLAADGADARGARRGGPEPQLQRAAASRSSPTSPESCSAQSRPPTPPTGSARPARRCASPMRSRP